jgi:23S rRNA (guanosine2251-2'-O)-methyltransferase
VASHTERNARPGAIKNRGGKPGRTPFRPRRDAVSDDWLWGWHAVVAALENPARPKPGRLLATLDRSRELEKRFGSDLRIEKIEGHAISQILPQGAVHQGLAVQIAEPQALFLEDIEPIAGAVLLLLDQVTDPQNVGAILRSAAAFGAAGVILQDRHAPKLSGTLAKAAAGAVDRLATFRVTNLSRTLETLSEGGWRTIGLAGQGSRSLDQTLDGRPTVLVLGSEGEGMRRLVAEHCDELAHIPMPGGFESLNVSAAAAVALYEASKPRS